jgi:hypothetical protein
MMHFYADSQLFALGRAKNQHKIVDFYFGLKPMLPALYKVSKTVGFGQQALVTKGLTPNSTLVRRESRGQVIAWHPRHQSEAALLSPSLRTRHILPELISLP